MGLVDSTVTQSGQTLDGSSTRADPRLVHNYEIASYMASQPVSQTAEQHAAYAAGFPDDSSTSASTDSVTVQTAGSQADPRVIDMYNTASVMAAQPISQTAEEHAAYARLLDSLPGGSNSATGTGSLSSMFSGLGSGSTSLTSALGALKTTDVSSLASGQLQSFSNLFQQTTRSGAANPKRPIPDVVQSIMSKAGGIPQAQTFRTSTITDATKAIAIGGQLTRSALTAFDSGDIATMASRIGSMLPDTDGAFSDLRKAVSENTFLNEVGGFFSEMGDAIGDGVSAVGDVASDVWDAGASVVVQAKSIIGDVVTGIDDVMVELTGMDTATLVETAVQTYATYAMYVEPILKKDGNYSATSIPTFYNASVPYYVSPTGTPYDGINPYTSYSTMSMYSQGLQTLGMTNIVPSGVSNFHYETNLFNTLLGLALNTNNTYVSSRMVGSPRFMYHRTSTQSMMRTQLERNYATQSPTTVQIILSALSLWNVRYKNDIAWSMYRRKTERIQAVAVAGSLFASIWRLFAQDRTITGQSIQWNQSPPTDPSTIIWNSKRIAAADSETIRADKSMTDILTQSVIEASDLPPPLFQQT